MFTRNWLTLEKFVKCICFIYMGVGGGMALCPPSSQTCQLYPQVINTLQNFKSYPQFIHRQKKLYKVLKICYMQL